MAKVVIQIEPLDCAGCGKKIEDQLYREQGVKTVKVFTQIGKIRTEFDQHKVDTDQLKEIVNSLGYPVQSIKES